MAPRFTPVGWDDRARTHFGATLTAMVTTSDAVADGVSLFRNRTICVLT